ncbi:MAG: membrane dipeptidase [Desulfuromonadales bacterium]
MIDGHVDLVYMLLDRFKARPFGTVSSGPLSPAAIERGNVRALVCALYCPDSLNGPDKALPFFEYLISETESLLSALPAIDSPEGLDTCLNGSRRPGRLLLLENADALADLKDFSRLRTWGIRTVGLTHAGRNRLACGNSVRDPQGLTAEGMRVVRELSRHPLALDVAHLASPGFYQLLEMTDRPLISSHTGLRAFCDTPRNLDNEQVRLLIERGGILGLSAAPEMLRPSGEAAFDDFLNQLDWLVQRYGAEGIALGSDFGGFDGINRGMEDCSCFAAAGEALLSRGYKSEAVSKIMGGNWARLYRLLLDN